LPQLNYCELANHTSPALVEVKGSSVFWLQPEDTLTGVTGALGSFNTARFAQRYFFSGSDLTLSGGESQKLQASDVSGLSANATAELSNLNKALSSNMAMSEFINTFSQASLANLSAEDLSRLGFLANPGSGFFSLDPLTRSEVSGSAQGTESKVLFGAHALSALRAENHLSLLSFLRKDLNGTTLAKFSGLNAFDGLSENAAALRSNGFGPSSLARSALPSITGGNVLGSAGLTELALRLRALGGIVA